MFKLTSSYFGIHKDFFDLSQIYENEKMLTLLFLAGDFREFHKISNESKLLKNLQVTFQEKLKQEVGFSKAWIFKNKIQVIDFDLKKNKIAFDIEVNEKKNSLHVWVLSRNKPDSLEFLRKNAIKVEGKKILIFDGMLNEKNKVIALIKEYIIQISNS